MDGMNEDIQLELELLRDFFDKWSLLHSLPKDNKERLQIAAQQLVDASHQVHAYRKKPEIAQ
jgi:hypothetical protein